MGARRRIDRPQGSDRGTAMIEFAIIVAFLAMVFSSVVDLGLAWRKSVEVSGTLRNGVRVTSGLGDDRPADLETLRALNAGIAEIGAADVRRVIVYEAATPTGAVPAQCLNVALDPSAGAGVSQLCNVYAPQQLAALTATRFGGSTTACEGDDWDRFYCPVVDRESRQGSVNGPDYVGIWIEVDYGYLFGVLGDGLTIRDDTVMRIEPQL
jgi:hypothetical protein